ncbi:MAG: deoxyribose-phosphate aldolase [Bdellovibrionales bacterium]|nr:deoxyribose-phosphate aldolase [Bdellovibrionales bacterium]
MKLNQYIDHTLLKADASLAQVEKLCQEARENEFFSVCVNSYYVKACVQMLNGSSVKICTVVGFPLGASTMETKRFEAMKAVAEGAREIDMVLNLSAVKSGNWQYALDDMSSLAQVCHQQGSLLKVIFENCLLTQEEKKKACELAVKAGVDFVKTSTGFSTSGATIEDVQLMRTIVGPQMGVKASGGIRNTETALAMIKAGASRLGTSASVDIVKGQDAGFGSY